MIDKLKKYHKDISLLENSVGKTESNLFASYNISKYSFYDEGEICQNEILVFLGKTFCHVLSDAYVLRQLNSYSTGL